MSNPRRPGVALALLTVLVTVVTTAAAAPASAATPNYVALGDSYSSGVGSGSYISSSGNCLRSTKAYSALWAAAHSPSSYASVACSGATTNDVINNQVGTLSASTSLVSITIGGNDVGFSSVLENCVHRRYEHLRQRHQRRREQGPDHAARPARQRVQRDPSARAERTRRRARLSALLRPRRLVLPRPQQHVALEDQRGRRRPRWCHLGSRCPARVLVRGRAIALRRPGTRSATAVRRGCTRSTGPTSCRATTRLRAVSPAATCRR